MGAVTKSLGQLGAVACLALLLAAPVSGQLLEEQSSTPPTAAPTPVEAPERQQTSLGTGERRADPDADGRRGGERDSHQARSPQERLAEDLAGPRASALPTEEHHRRPLLVLFLSLFGIGLALFMAERTRSWITSRILVRRALGALIWLLRLAGLGVAVAIVLQLIPGAEDWILWTLVALALVVGWSIRDLFADLVAGVVLAAERRIKKGVWVSGNGFQGTVEGRSLRATWLRDGQGHRLTVPNRAMVGAPMVYDSGADAEHEVVVRLEGYEDASKVRLALTDAILSSPWVLAGATPVVLRDPADPVVWRVRTKLLEPRFSVHFEGELLERVEDLLRYQPPSGERETVPDEAFDES